MRLTIDSTRIDLSLNRPIDLSRWNKSSGRMIGNREDARELNAYLESMRGRVYQAYREMIDSGEEITVERIRDRLTGVSQRQIRFLLDVFREHNQNMAKLVERREYAKGTLTRFETVRMHTVKFIQSKFKLADFPIEKLDYGFMNDFEFYLKSEVCAHNTAMKYLGAFKKIVLNCVRRNWLAKDPFMGYKLSKREVERDFLTEEELKAIFQKQFVSDRLGLVRDIFVFSCYTGLAYADVKKLQSSNIRKGIDGKPWLFVHRQKTGAPSAVPLLPIPLQILDRYAQHPRCQATRSALPVFSNQKMNEYLKEIGTVCGIQKALTYHIARHTFATSVTLNNNVPIESVSKMLGHKNLRQTQHYAKILNKKIAEDMGKLGAILSIQCQAK